MLATVQCLTTTSGFVFTGCSMIVSVRADTHVYRTFPSAIRYTRYTPPSTQRNIVLTGGSWMRLCCRAILPLSFIQDDTDRTYVQGIRNVVFLSALSRNSFFLRNRIAFPPDISISAFLHFKKIGPGWSRVIYKSLFL